MKNYDERWVCAFVSAVKREEIMKAAGIGKTRYYRLKADPEFMRIVNERRGAIVREAVLRMESHLAEAVDVLWDVVMKEDTSDQVRLNGINMLLSQFNNYKLLTDIQERIESLEKIAGEHNET